MKDKIIEKIKEVEDPELGINIVDLGLIYGIEIDESNNLNIKLTMTTPMCPFAPIIEKSVKDALGNLDEIKDVTIELVWDPPWSPEKMSEAAKLQLGIPGS